VKPVIFYKTKGTKKGGKQGAFSQVLARLTRIPLFERDLLQRQKRPTIEAKETYYRGFSQDLREFLSLNPVIVYRTRVSNSIFFVIFFLFLSEARHLLQEQESETV
jgi:hypothetical protein